MFDTQTYLALALNAGLTIADLYQIPMGWVIDIAVMRGGRYAEIVDAANASTDDLLGG